MSRPCHRTQKITFPVCYRQHRAMVLHYHVEFRSCVQKSLLGMHTDRQFQLGSRGKQKKKKGWKRDCIKKFGSEFLFPGKLGCFGLVLLQVKTQSSLHGKDSIKSETEHVTMHCLLSNRNENQPLVWFCTENSMKFIDQFRSPKQEGQGLCWEKAEFRSHLVNRKGWDQSDESRLGTLEISVQNSNRMGLSPLCGLPYLTLVPGGQVTWKAWTLPHGLWCSSSPLVSGPPQHGWPFVLILKVNWLEKSLWH